MTVELRPEADDEFAAEIDYFEAAEPGLGKRFYNEVIRMFDWIAANPTLPRMRKGYRRVNLRVFRFYIAYVQELDLIWVLAIAHWNRKPGYWRKRLGDSH